MTNAKWLALLAACGLALTMAACGDDGEDACPDNAQCLAATDACQSHCDLGTPETCTTDDDCGDNEICDTACGGCIQTCTADGGTGGTGGSGTCQGQADCYPDSYCGDTDVCVPLSSTVSECGYGPDAPQTSGPMLIWIEQIDENAGAALCVKDPAACTNNGNVCWFRVSAYDPDGDFPTSNTALYNQAKFVLSGSGNEVATFNTRNGAVDGTNPDFYDFEVAGCYDEATTNLAGGFLLLDNASHKSNTACVTFANGTAP